MNYIHTDLPRRSLNIFPKWASKFIVFADIRHRNTEQFDTVEFTYSWFMWMSGNHKYFVRVWRKDWNKTTFLKSFGESYGRSKFEAYRKAVKDLNS